jgi:hypothetical protein
MDLSTQLEIVLRALELIKVDFKLLPVLGLPGLLWEIDNWDVETGTIGDRQLQGFQ